MVEKNTKNISIEKSFSNIDFRLDFKIDQYPEETAICHEYDPIKNVWNKTEIIVKIEPTPFGNGSMRECFRLYDYTKSKKRLNEYICLEKNYLHIHRVEIGMVRVIILPSNISLMCQMHTISMMLKCK